ncbi:MAG: sporulation transcriptional regulator SpoIIID [Eubacterium sp.]|nr:sporulation transcriptional regulator SpoIIID [Eubacterium sp.]
MRILARNLWTQQAILRQKKTFDYVTTIHKDVTDRLTQLNPSLAAEARKVLDVNKSERHIRGGLATREKYLHQHSF